MRPKLFPTSHNRGARRESKSHHPFFRSLLGLFRKVGFECVDADWLQRLYRESQNAVATEIVFAQRTVIPEIPGVEQAYLGLLPASQFLKIVENDNSEVLTSIFYDNVRHWQDWNPVNTEMRGNSRRCGGQPLFPLA